MTKGPVHFLLSLALTFCVLRAQHVAAATVAVDGAQTYQTIDGFGVNANSLSWSGDELKPALTAGSHYWLAIWSNDPAARVYATSGGTIRWAPYNYGAWPPTITLPTGASTTYSLHAVAPPPTPYESWRQANFSAAQLADPAISGWNADPERDGWNNLLEYAFGYLPLAANPNASPIGGTDGDYLTLTYLKSKGTTDITVLAQVSSDLVNWSSASADVQQIWQFIDGDTAQRITARDLTPSPPAKKRFMRLRVTSP